jgi:hypothetical protein
MYKAQRLSLPSAEVALEEAKLRFAFRSIVRNLRREAQCSWWAARAIKHGTESGG